MKNLKENITIQKWISAISIILLCIKLYAYFITLSTAILSDTLESVVNVIAGLIGLYSLKLAAKPKDYNHPYGHGKIEFITAAIEGALIIGSSLIIVVETVKGVIYKTPILQINDGIFLIFISVLLNGIIGLRALNIGKKNKSMVLESGGKHLLIDSLSSIIILINLWLVHITNLVVIDRIVALIMAVIIFYNGWKILRKSYAGIMDEADENLLQEFIKKINLVKQENWIDLHNLRVIKYGSQLHIDCHITLPWYLTIEQGHKEIKNLECYIQQNFGDSIEFFVHTDSCMSFSCPICTIMNCTHRKQTFVKKVEWNVENASLNKQHQI